MSDEFLGLDDFGTIAAPPHDDPASNGASPPDRLIVRTAIEMVAIADPPEEYALLGPLVTRGGRTIVVGDTGHGKTTFALQMLGAIIKGEPMLGYQTHQSGPVLVIDLEQGLRSIKRGLRDAHLDERDDLLYLSVPDGLALDRDAAHMAALDAVLAQHQPTVVLLDPYYKAHRADDPNAERPIIDLMRQLDSLRTRYGFALVMPAHPRKDVAGREGARKLTIHDVAGSGAVTRGAEVVLGIERLGHGYARLRYLKDRDGDLAVGDVLTMRYERTEGFTADARANATDAGLREQILAQPPEWLTTNEWAKLLKTRRERVESVLAGLLLDTDDDGNPLLAFAVGPPGRRHDARCYTPCPAPPDNPGQVTLIPDETAGLSGLSGLSIEDRPERDNLRRPKSGGTSKPTANPFTDT